MSVATLLQQKISSEVSMRSRDALQLCAAMLVLIVVAYSCTPVPTEDSAPAGKPLSIDGMWEVTVFNQTVRVQMDGGRAFATDSRKLVLRDIEQISDSEFSCRTAFVYSGQFNSFIPCTVEILPGNKLLLEVPPFGGIYNGGSETWTRIAGAGSSSKTEPQKLTAAVQLNSSLDRIEVSSEDVEIEPGVIVKSKRSRKVEHTIEYTTVGALQTQFEFKVPPVFSEQIRVEIEKKLGRSFRQEEIVEQEVQLDGNINRKYRLIWYDKVRTGTAEFGVGGQRQSVPFRFKEWAELKVVLIDK